MANPLPAAANPADDAAPVKRSRSRKNLPAADSGADAKPKPKRTRKPAAIPPAAEPLSAEERYRRIAEVAYFIAQSRGFAPGDPTQDWLLAEAQVEAALVQSVTN